MLKRCISAEWMKLRHSNLWLLLIILPIISTLIGCANFYMNQEVLQEEWYSLWSQAGLFYGEFFFPILIAICCAFQCRLEHYNKNWNMVMTAPVSVSCIFFAKLIIMGILVLLVQVIFFVLFICSGKLVGLTSTLPAQLPGWFARGWLTAITISTMQLALSLRIRSFAIPVGIGLCATFVGLGMYVAHFGLFFPHSLLTIGMGVLSQSGLTSVGEAFYFYLMNLLYIILISTVAIHRMRRKDVIA